MKIRILGSLVTGIFLTLIIAAPARAQMPGAAIRATIPFNFIVRGKTLPAVTTRSGESMIHQKVWSSGTLLTGTIT